MKYCSLFFIWNVNEGGILMSKNRINIINAIFFIFWIVVYIIIGELIFHNINDEFEYLISKSSRIAESIVQYKSMIIYIGLFAGLLSVLWWSLGVFSLKWQEIFEENTFKCALIYILILLIGITVYATWNGPIVDEFDNSYWRLYEFCFLGGFIFNLFFLPPLNVKLVIAPGREWSRYVISSMALMIIVIFLYLKF